MRISEFQINRYGPLTYEQPVRLGNFNLLWGNNENGKTLTLEALIKLLLGSKTNDFSHIERVVEQPAGYVILKTDDGKEIKLPEKGPLSSIPALNLSADECRNIFIIRNSDLTISSESQFYTHVTDRLTGLRTSELKEIQNRLLGIGRLTPKFDFHDIKKDKLKSNIENANALCKQIEQLSERVNDEALDRLEEQALQKNEEIAEASESLDSLETARNRERYEKGSNALKSLQEATRELVRLAVFSREDEQRWHESKTAIQNAETSKQELTGKLEENERLFKVTIAQIRDITQTVETDSQYKRELETEIQPKLERYRAGSNRLAQQAAQAKLWNTTAIASSLLLALSLVGSIINQNTVIYALIAISTVFTAISWGFKFGITRTTGKLAGLLNEINLDLSKYELDDDSITGILPKLQLFAENCERNSAELNRLQVDEQTLRNKITEIRDETIPGIESRMLRAKESIDAIGRKVKVETLSEYSRQLKRQEQLTQTASKAANLLESHFGTIGNSPAEKTVYWESEVAKLAGFKNQCTGITYNEDIVQALKTKLSTAQDELGEINQRTASFQRELEEISTKSNRILDPNEGQLICAASSDLAPVHSRLKDYINANEKRRENVIQVMDIFSEIESAEKARVSELFGADSAVSRYFAEITDGLYQSVDCDAQQNILVTRRDGLTLEPYQLSGGAYDQLYLAIRLVLGEQLLKGKPGFFIVDDPFIKADPLRLETQLAVLKHICEHGWQVIYFSAKGEVHDALAEDIKAGRVNYYEIKNSFA